MSRKRGGRSPRLLIAVLVIAALAGAGWYVLRGTHLIPAQPFASAPPVAQRTPLAVASDHVDARNDGRTVVIEGRSVARSPARDAELGVSASDALALLRHVEMRQWRETCSAAACTYALVWSDKPIDWHAFRERKGHENSMPFPFSSQRFSAVGVHIGAFNISTSLAVAGGEAVAYPVRVAQLPPNLAATFREQDGVLYTGGAGNAPAAGDLRISYQIVPTGEQRLIGIQKGDRLLAPGNTESRR